MWYIALLQLDPWIRSVVSWHSILGILVTKYSLYLCSLCPFTEHFLWELCRFQAQTYHKHHTKNFIKWCNNSGLLLKIRIVVFNLFDRGHFNPAYLVPAVPVCHQQCGSWILLHDRCSRPWTMPCRHLVVWYNHPLRPIPQFSAPLITPLRSYHATGWTTWCSAWGFAAFLSPTGGNIDQCSYWIMWSYMMSFQSSVKSL